MPEQLLMCYNKGCGHQFLERENTKDSCTYHPGEPVFHDAYKGWSCCKRRFTDFTEFLNTKGCAKSYHNNIKPQEPIKPEKSDPTEVVVRGPVAEKLPRPPFDEPLKTIKPIIASNLIEQFNNLELNNPVQSPDTGDKSVAVGTLCKHGGCKVEYQGPDQSYGNCYYHPGLPVFHEGLKFWSCCTKRTSDFSEFLKLVGCVQGEHRWIDEVGARANPMCRHDWYQTGNLVIITIFAKKYDPYKSTVQLNDIRAKINLVFPEKNAEFTMDIELRGVIDVEQCEVNMLSTKVEITLRKAEPGSWNNLNFPRNQTKIAAPQPTPANAEEFDDEPVDLSLIE